MNVRFTLLSMTMALFAFASQAQRPSFPKPDKSKNISFGQKQPAPSLLSYDQKNLLKTLYPGADKLPNSDAFFEGMGKSARYLFKSSLPLTQQLANRTSSVAQVKKGPQGLASNFHISSDINLLAESDPGNIGSYIIWLDWVYPVANNVAYFEADDGVHGRELMRSDGTAAGTYLVKDINPGETSTLIRNMIAINGKVYFSASTDGYSYHPWVTDGTEAGTQIIDVVNYSSSPQQFIQVGNTIYFITDGYSYRSAIWRIDGTPPVTSFVTDLASTFQGYDIEQATVANGLLFFSLYNYSYGKQLWRSDGTEIGTFSVSPLLFNDYYWGPLQLTPYNNELFFSFDDGTGGHKLWVSDGTPVGTIPAPGNHDIILPLDNLYPQFSQPFPVLNNVLYLSGNDYTGGNGYSFNNGLYKYDASNNDGLVLVKQITSNFEYNVIIPGETRITGNTLYMKVISEIGGSHYELWKTNGDAATTQLLRSFETGSDMGSLKSGYGTLYFVKTDAIFGSELWKSDGTTNGTTIVRDVNPGPTNSQPWYMTELNGKVIFSLHETKTGAELWSTNGSASGTILVKDINTRATQGSWANFSYKGAAVNDGIVFVAYEKQHGDELYASNGTQSGTKLINDILPGENTSRPRDFLSKNNYAYFIGFPTADGMTASIYRTNGEANGLKKIFSYNSYPYSDGYYSVADNGIVFTVIYNSNTGNYDLWRSDGTTAGSLMLASNLYWSHSMVTSGNQAFFVAGDITYGYELWKSDGTIAGTKMVKDIAAGFVGSYPYSLFSYGGNVYFGASDENYNPGLWKSNGTEAGTVKLSDLIVPFTYNNGGLSVFEAVSGNTLYMNAALPNNYQGFLWKTDGTVNGTQQVSTDASYPTNLTDVKGTLFFVAYDQNGEELWKTNGQAATTKVVKNLNYYSPQYLTSAGSKLYFTLNDVLWSSDGTDAGTQPVDDPLLSGLNSVTNLIGTNNKLFFSAYTYQYGFELFVGNAASSSLNVQSVNRQDLPEQIQQVFKIYPSPAKNVLNINYYQQNAGRISITVTDVNGKTMLNKHIEGTAGNQLIPLSVQTLPAGAYFLRLNGERSVVKQFVKQD